MRLAVFISCASRDRALVEGLLTALRRARQPVWLDEELTGGDAWWRTILEQIRDCEVFIAALSKNMLESKACQAELRYAQDLGKAILPVQIGPLDNLRINPLAHMQVINSPPPPATGPQPLYQPPPGGPPPPPDPMVDTADMDSILLTADEVHATVGRSDLVSTAVLTDMDNTPLTVSDPDCAGVVGTALGSVYAGSGHTSVRDQAFTHDDPDYFVAQTAVLFPDVDQSRTFVNTLADKWNRCVGKTVSIASPTGDERWTVDAVTQSDSQVIQRATAEAAAGYGRQHVLRVVSNVVLGADVCHDDVADDAARIVEELAANVPG